MFNCNLEVSHIKQKFINLRNELTPFVKSNNLESDSRSKMWGDNWNFLNYIFDLSPDNLFFIRQHASLLSDRSPFIYWSINPNLNAMDNPESFIYMNYIMDLPEKYWLSEWENPLLPKQHGFLLNGKTINRDIVRYQSVISNLFTSELFKYYMEISKHRPVYIIEIGGGYGGMAYQLWKYINNCRYILVDLPESLYMAGCFLSITNPEISIGVVTSERLHSSMDMLNQYKILLVPSHLSGCLTEIKSDLLLNMLSFQEMTENAVRNYAILGANTCTGYLYSANCTKHQCNSELTSVEQILNNYFILSPSIDAYEVSNLKDQFLSYNSQNTKVFIGRSKIYSSAINPKGYIRVGDGSQKIEL